MILWKIEDDGYGIEGFFTEDDVDNYIKNHKGKWVKSSYEAKKLDATFDDFFKFFNLPKQEITMEQRERLEGLLTSLGESHSETYNGETYEMFNQYSIEYYSDQWSACALTKLVKIDNEYYSKEILRGEGNSFTEALCSLCILASDLFADVEREWLKDIFE